MPQSYNEAFNHYRKGALKDISDCQNGIGWIYNNGLGVKKNIVEAIEWYELAADQNHKEAQFNLGIIIF